tara:strand:- start:1100 stop:1678 length:579 start_codon:yes stop_codon:yes gene_type:complete
MGRKQDIKIKFTIILIIFFFTLLKNTYAESFKDIFKEGGKIIFIRHANAPGNGDPNNFKLNDCTTQRNLDQKGINQSKRIGNFFKKNNIPIDKILTSEWCRCKDTAKYAFNNYKTFSALNSFYDIKFKKNKKKQINDLKKYIENWNNLEKNLVLITHFVVIMEITGKGASSGEMIVVDKKFNLIGNFRSDLE